MTKKMIILTNAVVSLGLAGTGLTRLLLRDPFSGMGYEWSAFMLIIGLVTLFLIPLEVCIIKPQRKT